MRKLMDGGAGLIRAGAAVPFFTRFITFRSGAFPSMRCHVGGESAGADGAGSFWGKGFFK